MTTTLLKNKINKSLSQMDEAQLQSAWLILKELESQRKYATAKIDTHKVNANINKGIRQLDNGEGTSFGVFLNETNKKYAGKK